MQQRLLDLGFGVFLGAWLSLILVGLGADVLRWLQRRQQPSKGVAQRLRRAH